MSMFKPFLNKKHAESSLQVPNSYIILDKSYSRKRNEMELSMILSCNHINKAFGTDEILSEVSFHIEEWLRKVHPVKDHCRRACR